MPENLYSNYLITKPPKSAKYLVQKWCVLEDLVNPYQKTSIFIIIIQSNRYPTAAYISPLNRREPSC